MNPIPSGGLETAPTYAEPTLTTDPVTRFRNLMAAETVRKEIYDRVEVLAREFLRMYGCKPTWVRVSFDLVHKAGAPVFREPCSIWGLVFRPALEWNDRIEVGSSVLEDKPKNA
jgi:hypothetical protein